MNKYEIVARWSNCDNEFHYTAYINGAWFCSFCSLEIVLAKLREYFKTHKV